MSPLRTALLLVSAVLAGCDDRASAGTLDASSSSSSSSAVSARPLPSASALAEKPELRVLKLVMTSEVKKKEPVDRLEAAKPGQRVWAHLTVRNRYPMAKTITLVFRVNGEERSTIDLPVEPAWSYRTWGYVTLRASDAGELVAEVREEGRVMESARLMIKGEGTTKPQSRPMPLND